MKRIAFWLSWLCAVAAFRLAHYAKDGVGEADDFSLENKGFQPHFSDDELKPGGTISDD